MKPVVATVACAAVIATGLSACGSSGGHNASRAVQPPAQAQAQAQLPAAPAAPQAIGPALPAVPAPPNIAKAQAAVQTALRDVEGAAAAVFARGAATAPPASVITSDLSAIQQQVSLAFTAGQAGRCADSFKASRAANAALKPTGRDLATLSRSVAEVRQTRSHYGLVRRDALASLQNLYNAVAGHPLSAGPSASVDQLRSAISNNDGATAQAVSQASALLSAAHGSMTSARQATKTAALAPCMDVSG